MLTNLLEDQIKQVLISGIATLAAEFYKKSAFCTYKAQEHLYNSDQKLCSIRVLSLS